MSELDEVWTVAKPRNGSHDAVQEMNAKMMAWHPALERTRDDDHSVLRDAYDVLSPSLAAIVQYGQHL